MSLRWLQLARRASQLLGAGLCAALGMRIMIGAVAAARAPRALDAAPPNSPVLAELPVDLPKDVVKKASKPPIPAAPAPPSGGAPLRLILSVVVGPQRSDVFVNGRRVGTSPYVGDFTCKQGENLRIEVVPVTEPLITRHAKCQGQALLVRD